MRGNPLHTFESRNRRVLEPAFGKAFNELLGAGQVTLRTETTRQNQPTASGWAVAFREFGQRRVLKELPRLLREGAGPVGRLIVQARNAAAIAARLREGKPLNFVSSFPRSGNTWMRYLLTDVLLQQSGVATSTDLPTHPDRVVPDFYCHLISRRAQEINSPAMFVKTHDDFDVLERRFSKASASNGKSGPLSSNCKHLYLFRSPEDSLVSLYHYFDRHQFFKSQSACGPDAFCLSRLDSWMNNLTSYTRASERGAPLLLVKYENLLDAPAAVLTEILHWFDIRREPNVVWRAVLNMHFSNLRALEIKERSSAEGSSFRRGTSGGGAAELKPETLQVIHEKTAALLEKASKMALPQLAESHKESEQGRVPHGVLEPAPAAGAGGRQLQEAC